jgi:hypothetical protein
VKKQAVIETTILELGELKIYTIKNYGKCCSVNITYLLIGIKS